MTDTPREIDLRVAEQAAAEQAATGQQVMFGIGQWTGPYPPPGAMREYNEILPGAAERMLAMAERDLAARHEREADAQRAYTDTAKTGQAIAALLAFICVTASILFFAFGNRWAGTAFLGLPSVLLIRSFLFRDRS